MGKQTNVTQHQTYIKLYIKKEVNTVQKEPWNGNDWFYLGILVGPTTVVVCLGLRDFPGCRTFSAKNKDSLDNSGLWVNLNWKIVQ